jgi:hypothetical protein
MDDLNRAFEFGAPGKRPLLMAAGLVAIAALGISGLYQGFRFTWRDYGPAPSYPQIAAAAPQAAPQPVADTPPTIVEARNDRVADPNDAAADTAASPLAASVQAAIDSLQSPSAATGTGVPTAAIVQPTAYSPPASPTPEQISPAAGSSATAPAAPGQAPVQPPQ